MVLISYSDFPLQPHEIRLLSLDNSSEGSVTGKWILQVVSLTEVAASYYAVSYRWGAPLLEGRFQYMTNDSETLIQFKNGSLKVTQNLAEFLDQVRADKELRGKKFWVDAICINQSDDQERSYQVSTMMAKIYQSAVYVIAWLGDADLHTKQAFDHLDILSKWTSFPDALGPSSCFDPSLSDDAGGNPWVAIIKLFNRTYWNRSWIIQELVLAENVIIRCGNYSRDWSVLSRASHIICTSTLREFFTTKSPQRGTGQLMTTAPRNHGIPTILQATKQAIKTKHWTDVLLYTLIRSRDFEATNAEDKVYALLGLIQASVDIRNMPLLHPEFGGKRSAAKAYLNIAIQLIRDSAELLLLSCVEGRPFQKAQLDDRCLPSWVPDWSVALPLGLRVTGYERYCADACFGSTSTKLSREEKLQTWPATIDERALTLTLSGLEVDEIVDCGESKRGVLSGNPFPRLLKILLTLPLKYATTGEGRLEAFWRTLIGNTSGSERLPPPKGSYLGKEFTTWFQEIIKSVTPSQEDFQWTDLKHQFNEVCRNNEEWQDLSASSAFGPASTTPTAMSGAYRLYFSCGNHLRMFLTAKGYLGIGSENLKEGDTVWIVPRSRVPLIFRLKNNADSVFKGCTELVGGAYLHGFMDGQEISAAAKREGTEAHSLLKPLIIK